MGASVAAGPRRPDRSRPGRSTVLLLVATTLVGLALRLRLGTESLFADELSSWWIVTSHGPFDVVRVVASDAEITPPLFFVLAWTSTVLGDAPLLLRLPSLAAGVLTVPAVFLLGRRVSGDRAALVAAALVALAPFMAYYAAEARGYAVMLLALVLGTLALVRAAAGEGRRWWALHAVAVAAAMYAHYTAVFVLAAQFAWVLLRVPAARRGLLAATAASVTLYLPWLPGAYADVTSPTQGILDALSPFSPAAAVSALAHWTIGYPYAIVGLRAVPGPIGLLLLVLAAVTTVAGVALARRRAGRGVAHPGRAAATPGASGVGPGLLVALALATPAATAAISVVGSDLFSTRNLAASWPYLALVVGAAVAAVPGRALRAVAVAALLVGIGLGAVRTALPGAGRPDAGAAAARVDALVRPGDVVVDLTGALSPGPATALDPPLATGVEVVRGAAPSVRDRPFVPGDGVATTDEALAFARGRLGPGGRLLVVGAPFPGPARSPDERVRALAFDGYPADLRRVAAESWRSFLGDLRLDVLVPQAPASGGPTRP